MGIQEIIVGRKLKTALLELEETLQKINNMDSSDPERDRLDADKALLDFFKKIYCDDIVELYDGIKKWYA